MVRIRLRRTGLRNQPSYRIVAADKESPRDGRFLEILGNYNPRTKPYTLEVKEDRVYHWIGNGAQMSETVERLFKECGLIDRYERYKTGESLDTLMEESKKYFDQREIDLRTRRPAE
jgi:small subunit ribosomal protein S16